MRKPDKKDQIIVEGSVFDIHIKRDRKHPAWANFEVFMPARIDSHSKQLLYSARKLDPGGDLWVPDMEKSERVLRGTMSLADGADLKFCPDRAYGGSFDDYEDLLIFCQVVKAAHRMAEDFLSVNRRKS